MSARIWGRVIPYGRWDLSCIECNKSASICSDQKGHFRWADNLFTGWCAMQQFVPGKPNPPKNFSFPLPMIRNWISMFTRARMKNRQETLESEVIHFLRWHSLFQEEHTYTLTGLSPPLSYWIVRKEMVSWEQRTIWPLSSMQNAANSLSTFENSNIIRHSAKCKFLFKYWMRSTSKDITVTTSPNMCFGIVWHLFGKNKQTNKQMFPLRLKCSPDCSPVYVLSLHTDKPTSWDSKGQTEICWFPSSFEVVSIEKIDSNLYSSFLKEFPQKIEFRVMTLKHYILNTWCPLQVTVDLKNKWTMWKKHVATWFFQLRYFN